MDKRLFYFLLAQIPFLSFPDFAYLRAQMEELSLEADEFFRMKPIERRKNFRLPNRIHNYLDGAPRNLSALKRMQIQLARQRVRFLTAADADYPQRLRDLPEEARPTFLFLKGEPPALARPYQIAIAGTRRATPPAMRVTRSYARALAAHGANIISGAAAGIDTEAHVGALEAHGVTTIVLPQGILTFIPRPPLKRLLTLRNALIVSQFPPLQPWTGACAVQRNSVISALAQAAIIGETLLRSGTSYVIRQMLRDRKPLFVIAYEGDGAAARASRSLLSSGAHPLPPVPAAPRTAVSRILRACI